MMNRLENRQLIMNDAQFDRLKGKFLKAYRNKEITVDMPFVEMYKELLEAQTIEDLPDELQEIMKKLE